MELFVGDAAQPPVAPAPHDLVLGPEGVRVRLRVAGDEELVQAALTLNRYDGSETPPFSPPEVSTDQPDNALGGIAWVKADWGSARVLRSFSLTFASAAGLRVRVQIARGKSSWFSPPGPHTFDVADSATAVTLSGSFPDTVADRVMFELLHKTSDATSGTTSGTPATATLQEPPDLAFGSHARDLAVRVSGGRDFFTHTGELPASGIEVADLLDVLREAAGGTLTDADIELELRAGVTGFAALTWSFAANRIVRVFAANGKGTRRLALTWGQEAVEPLLPVDNGQVPFQPASLALALASEPVRERIALAPVGNESLGQAVAGLGRPLHDNAQAFSLALDQPLVGVDLWARPLSERVALRVAVHADEGGRPAPAPMQASEERAAAGTRVIESAIEDPGALPAGPVWPMWIDVPLDAPVQPPDSAWWLVVQVEEGELLWFLGGARPTGAGAVRHRRNQGAWLALDAERADAWALARLRVLDTEPPPPVEAHLLLTPAAAEAEDIEIALAAGADGMLRWTAGADTPAAVTRMDLRLHAPVAGQVTLSSLRLTYGEGNAP